MKWTKTEGSSSAIYWHCTFTTVPFSVMITPTHDGVLAALYLVWNDATSRVVSSSPYSSVEEAKADVNNLVMNHLAQLSAQVHRECLNANVMTWRKLKEQLDQIPEDQLDETISHLDTDGYWVGEPRVELTDCDMYADEEDYRDCTGNTFISEDAELVVEKGKYFLSTCGV